jgi:hypothetical protein
LNSLKNILPPVIIQRRTSFTRNLRRATPIGQRQLLTEHREGAVRLRRVAQAIENILDDQEVLREDVDRIVRNLIDNERKHIALEDEVVFPAIVDTLQPADWADVALTLADRYGPPSQQILRSSSIRFAETYSNLRRPQLRGVYSVWVGAGRGAVVGNCGRAACLLWVTSKHSRCKKSCLLYAPEADIVLVPAQEPKSVAHET